MDPLIGEIRMFAGTFAPQGWALCEGQLLSVSQNEALFSILGTIYGGDGRTTFGLPDLRGRIPTSAGTGPGLKPVIQGQKFGTETNVINASQMAPHTHTGGEGEFLPLANTAAGGSVSPEGRYMANSNGDGSDEFIYTQTRNNPVNLGPQEFPITINNTGGSGQGIYNQQPTLTVTYIIALLGRYPSRNP
ncbi:MAG: phage tail protein [Bacteroidetes bacterium]|nr:phage tail protein [Bacteroidota bacterium]MCB0846388.1 phage tail protein [Bacteroidota bacterium]